MSYPDNPTTEDLIRFFKAFQKPCPFCGHDYWGVSSATQPIMLITEQTDVANENPSNYYPCRAAICMNCGFVRLHEARIVGIWIDNHPENLDGTGQENHTVPDPTQTDSA